MPSDFVLRLIEQIGIMLAELARLKPAQKPERLSAICLQETGLSFDLCKRSSPRTIIELLATGGATQYARAVVLAELFLQVATMVSENGNEREAVIRRAQARALLEHSVPHLSNEEQAMFQPKLDALKRGRA